MLLLAGVCSVEEMKLVAAGRILKVDALRSLYELQTPRH
jgi:hypothetical protein